MSTGGGTRAIVAALGANLGIAVTKLIAFGLTGASSMLAEAIHSIADSGNQALLLIGGRKAQKSADSRHPFGYGRERYLYAFVVSIVLFSVGGLFALYEGYHKVSHPEAITQWAWVPIVVLVVAIGLEGFSFRTAMHETNLIKGNSSLAAFIRHSRIPELPVVLLEDAAALIGLVMALLGVGLTLITDNGVWDGIGTLAIGALLVAVAVVLAIETKSLLIGESATAEHVGPDRGRRDRRRRHRARHPHEHTAPRPRGATGRGQGRRARAHHRRRGRRGDRRRRSGASGRLCRSPG